MSLLLCLLSFLLVVPSTFCKPFTWSATSDTYGHRKILLGSWTSKDSSGIYFNSTASSPSDLVWGAIQYGKTHPISWVAYFNDYTRSPPIPAKDFTTFNVTAASSFIATAFFSLTERTPNGTLAQNVTLANLYSTLFNYSASANLSNTDEGIYAFVIDGKARLASGLYASIQFQYLITSTAGLLDYLDGVPLVPVAIESIIIINNWPYISTDNSLSLTFGAFTNKGSWTTHNKFISGEGSSQTFLQVSLNAAIGEQLQPVTFKQKYTTTDFTPYNMNLRRQLLSLYNATAQLQVVEVVFPAGAESIIYDPTSGSGDFEGIFPSPASSDTGLIIGLSVGLGVAFLLAVGVVLYLKAPEYSSPNHPTSLTPLTHSPTQAVNK